MTEITQDIVLELMDYDPASGILTWRERQPKHFADGKRHSAETNCKRWNSTWAGKEAGAIDPSTGYRHFRLLGKDRYAHRLIWMYVHGEWPDQIDHINRNKLDNRLSNLRSVNRILNAQNQCLSKNNTSGHKGVHWFKPAKRWWAYINVNRKRMSLGYFKDKSDAIAARQAAEQEYGFL